MLRILPRPARLLGCVLAGLAAATSPGAEASSELGRPILQTFPPGLHLRHAISQTFTQDDAGWIYFANGADLLAFDGRRWIHRPLPDESAGVRQFARAPDGTIYAAGAGVIGFLRGTGAAVDFVSLREHLPADARDIDELRHVAAAGDAVVFADAAKLLVWREGRFTVLPLPAPPGRPGARLHVVDGRLLVSALGRPLQRLEEDRLVPVADDPRLREEPLVTVVTGAAPGDLLALTATRGFLALAADGTVTTPASPLHRWLAGERVFRARRLDDGSWAVALAAASGNRGLLFRPDGTLASRLGQEAGLYSEQVRDFLPDREGGLWVSLDAGAARLEWPSPATRFDAVNGLGHGAVLAVIRHEGAIHAATEEGIFRLQPADAGGGARFVPVDDPATDLRQRLAEAGASAGDAAVRTWPGELPVSVRAALGEPRCGFEEQGPGGRVRWLGGTAGLLRVELGRAFAAVAPLLVQLAAEGVAPDAELAPEHEPLTFRFLAIRQQSGNPVTYRTRVLGQQDAWSGWGEARERFIARLPAGNYVFEVQARDAAGTLSAPARLAFRVSAPWWAGPWAVAAAVAAGGAAFFGALHWRTRALRRRAAQLERIVQERTEEIAAKNRELTRLHRLEFDEKVAARLAEEKARLEVLRYQLNPHFLFNTLASISAALPAGGSTARAMLDRLAEFCRLTLRGDDDREWTTLGEEMRLLRAYLEIEQSRWGDLLDVEIDCAPELAESPLPHFLILPLVENALKYGRATSPDRVGLKLSVRRRADGTFEIGVANTGSWVDSGTGVRPVSLGIGLENLRERLARHYPRAHRLDIAAADGWVTVTLQLAAAPAR